MPLSKHYSGHGVEVAASMKKEYGDRWKEVFYATENARKKHEIIKKMRKAKKVG